MAATGIFMTTAPPEGCLPVTGSFGERNLPETNVAIEGTSESFGKWVGAFSRFGNAKLSVIPPALREGLKQSSKARTDGNVGSPPRQVVVCPLVRKPRDVEQASRKKTARGIASRLLSDRRLIRGLRRAVAWFR